MASLSLLFFQQFWEFIALGKRYFLELESWFKMLIFSLVLTTLFFLGNPDVIFFAECILISKYNILSSSGSKCSRFCSNMPGLD